MERHSETSASLLREADRPREFPADPFNIEQVRFDAMIRHSPCFIGIADRDANTVFVNQAGRKMLRLDCRTDISAIAIADFVFHEDRAKVIEEILPCTFKDGSWQGETRFRRFDNEDAWVPTIQRTYSHFDDNGAFLGLATIAIDISEQKRIEAALRQSEAQLRAATELVGLSSYTWDPQTDELQWDARLKAMWGLPADAEVTAQIWRNAIHPDDLSRVDTAVSHCLDPTGDGVYSVEYRVIGITDGVERWVSTYGRTVFESSKPVCFYGAVLDVTKAKRAQDALAANESRFRYFAENSTNMLWILNVDRMEFEYRSPAFERIWQKPIDPDRPQFSLCLDTVYPEDLDATKSAVEGALKGECMICEYRILRPDRSMRWIRNSFFPMQDENGEIHRIAGIAEDVTRHDATLVYLVETDSGCRRTIHETLQQGGYNVHDFSSARDFVRLAPTLGPSCIIAGLGSLEINGQLLPQALKALGLEMPVVVVADSDVDVNVAVRVMRAGAVDFLGPDRDADALLAATAIANEKLDADPDLRPTDNDAREKLSKLSAREREVLELLLAGGTNKTIGRQLGLSPRTIEVHRAHVMQSLDADSLPEAIRIAIAGGFHSMPKCEQANRKRKEV